LSYAVVSRLDPSVTHQEFNAEFVAPPECTNLADFLTRAPRGFQLMQTEEAIRLVIEDLFEQLLRDHVIYVEIRFAPLLHTAGGLSPDAVVAAADRATEQCIRATGIDARLILCTLRHFDPAQSILTAQLVERFKGSRVVALDIAGDEAAFSIDSHVPAYQFAIEHGLNRTAHAGEACDARSIWETLKAFQPSRIGHGIRSAEDPILVEYLRRQQIHLEVCPSSNIQTRACLKYDDHPVDVLFRAGVSLGINTDTRTITNVTLEQEYDRIRAHFGWRDEEFMVCNREALRAAFIDEPVRAALLARLESSAI
jgi:adenosine deaminase